MKKAIAVSTLLILLIGGFAMSRKLTAKNVQQIQVPSRSPSVVVESCTLVPTSEPRPGSNKLIITLKNNSDKDVYFWQLITTAHPDGKPSGGFGLYGTKKDKLYAHSSVTYERILSFSSSGQFKPELYCVVFDDGSFEGDEGTAIQTNVNKKEHHAVLDKYAARFLAIDQSASLAADLAKLRQDLLVDLKQYAGLDDLGPIQSKDDKPARIALLVRRGTLQRLVGEVSDMETKLNAFGKIAPDFGRKLVDSMRSAF